MSSKFFFFIAFTFCLLNSYSQESQRYYQHAIVNPEHRPIIDFWINFLYEENDSIRKSYWNKEERNKLGSYYCLFCNNFFQYPRIKQLEYFKPYILSIEERDNQYFIKTAFWHFDFDPSDSSNKNQNPAGIITVVVEEEEDNLRLRNVLSYRTSLMKNFQQGKLKYFVDANTKIDTLACIQASQFSDSIANVWNTSYDSINYYVSGSPEELGRLLGFDFFYYGYSNGVSLLDAHLLMATANNFVYRHELVHMVLGSFPNALFSEGLATYMGGSHNIPYDSLAIAFIEKYPSLSMIDVENILIVYNARDFYVLGAMICNIVHQNKGIAALKELGKCSNGNEKLLGYASNLLEIRPEEFLSLLRKN